MNRSKIKAAGVGGVGVEAGAAMGEGGRGRRLLPGMGHPQIRNGYNGGDGGWCVVMMVAYYITI